MELVVALTGSRVRALPMYAGDEMTVNLTLYATDGASSTTAYTNPLIRTDDVSLTFAVGTQFTVPDDICRRPYRLTADIAGVTTTIVTGYIEPQGNTEQVCMCPRDYC